jgi:hypothetical protein
VGIPASSESVSEIPAEEPAQPEGAPTPPEKQRFRRTRRVPRLRVVLSLFGDFIVRLCWSIGSVPAAPDDDSAIARIAEWARDHHLSPVATFLEDQQHQAHPPKIGGKPVMALAPNGEPVQNSSSLIVDHGKVQDSVGVTADGRMLFAYGPALSVRTLADLLASAGAAVYAR